MPSYGSNRSSLKKMDYTNGRYGGGGKRFDVSHIVGDPFSLATIAIAIVSEARHGQGKSTILTRVRLVGSSPSSVPS